MSFKLSNNTRNTPNAIDIRIGFPYDLQHNFSGRKLIKISQRQALLTTVSHCVTR